MVDLLGDSPLPHSDLRTILSDISKVSPSEFTVLTYIERSSIKVFRLRVYLDDPLELVDTTRYTSEVIA